LPGPLSEREARIDPFNQPVVAMELVPGELKGQSTLAAPSDSSLQKWGYPATDQKALYASGSEKDGSITPESTEDILSQYVCHYRVNDRC
jgi:hypothetical protein